MAVPSWLQQQPTKESVQQKGSALPSWVSQPPKNEELFEDVEPKLASTPIGKFKIGSLAENIIGEGEVDTIGEYAGQAIKEGASATARGLSGLASLPEFALAGGRYLTEKALGKETTPFPTETYLGTGLKEAMQGAVDAGTYLLKSSSEMVIGNSLDDVEFFKRQPEIVEFKGDTIFSPFISTVGEFYGAGPVSAATGISALASETAGQVAQKVAPEKETYARFFGALSPSLLSAGNKTLQAVTAKNYSGPTLTSLKQEMDLAWDNMKFKAPTIEKSNIAKMRQAIQQKLTSSGDYFPSTAGPVNNALKYLYDSISTKTGVKDIKPMELELIKRTIRDDFLPSAKRGQKVHIYKIMDGIDEALTATAANEKYALAAKNSSSNYYKAKTIDDLISVADRKLATQRFGGDKVAGYKRVMNQILNSPSRANFFREKELELMNKIVNRKFGGTIVDTLSRFSMNGNGFMAGLNMMAAAVEPTILGLSAMATATGKAREVMVDNAVKELRRMAAAGGMSKKDVAKMVTKQFVIDLADESLKASRRAATIQEQ